jgi:hypothetical protein
MVDLVSQAGFARRPAQALEAGIDVEERQVAGKCRMHDRFLLVLRRYGR